MHILLDRKEVDGLESCCLCPRECFADRINGETGYCGMTASVKVGRAALHMWEEPCISGSRGSGTVFFCGCNLKCLYCQNKDISFGDSGTEITIGRLGRIFLELQEQKAHNINLVTPTHFVPQIIAAVGAARKEGLVIPVVYNSGSYENVQTIEMLKGVVDIYLPDLKYFDPKLGAELSNAPDYFTRASEAISVMVKQQPEVVFDDDGMMLKGVIVRHLVLPGHTDDSIKVLKHLYTSFGDRIYLSIMNQYTPLEPVSRMPEMSRRVTDEEYDKVIEYALSLGVENAFIQEGDTAKESFIPAFNGEGI